MIVSLIGYRGSGKSTVGRLLAGHLGDARFVDTDIEVERIAGRSIAEIFAADGEAAFRDLEASALLRVLDGDDGEQSLVLATGGGIILRGANRVRLREAGPVVWLTASAECLALRINADADAGVERPALTGRSAAAEVREVLERRRDLYMQTATITEPTEDRTAGEIAASIIQRFMTASPEGRPG